MLTFTPLTAVVAFSYFAHGLPQVTVVTDASASSTPTASPIGAKTTVVLAPSIPKLPPAPDATTYPRNGLLNAPQPAPYVPAGGLGTNGSEPNYQVKSDFDFESIVSHNMICAVNNEC